MLVFKVRNVEMPPIFSEKAVSRIRTAKRHT
jgi:hypothetical protein